VTIDRERIAALIARRVRTVDVLLVEGAGGLLVPIVGTYTFCDLAVRLELPLVVVAANRLGTVNHTALTIRVAEAAGLAVRGFVLSQPAPVTDLSAETNATTIAALTGHRCLGIVPHLTRFEDAVSLIELPIA